MGKHTKPIARQILLTIDDNPLYSNNIQCLGYGYDRTFLSTIVGKTQKTHVKQLILLTTAADRDLSM